MSNKGQSVISAKAKSRNPNRKKPSSQTRRLPIGAEPAVGGGAHFRVWAPKCARVAIELSEDARFRPGQKEAVELEPEENGYFCGFLPEAHPEMLYKFRTQAGS